MVIVADDCSDATTFAVIALREAEAAIVCSTRGRRVAEQRRVMCMCEKDRYLERKTGKERGERRERK